jgi:hypothetical protein
MVAGSGRLGRPPYLFPSPVHLFGSLAGIGQLLMLFPEWMLGGAILLLTLGTLITGGMIWFNLQREKLLQRTRIFRADLASWT